MTDTMTTFLYALSTLAQTCSALAAFVGAIGLYRLQHLHNEHAVSEDKLRGLYAAATLSKETASRQTIEEIVRLCQVALEQPSSVSVVVLEGMQRVLAEWNTFGPRLSHATSMLMIFEAWNLIVIGCSLAGFNYVPSLAGSSIAFWGIWVAAVGTVLVTAFCLFVFARTYR